MFSKPRYSSDDLQKAVQGLETLEKLRDRVEQAARLIPAKRELYEAEWDRYTQAIKSRQRLILFMQEEMNRS